jgi:hypothetical protein
MSLSLQGSCFKVSFSSVERKQKSMHDTMLSYMAFIFNNQKILTSTIQYGVKEMVKNEKMQHNDGCVHIYIRQGYTLSW